MDGYWRFERLSTVLDFIDKMKMIGLDHVGLLSHGPLGKTGSRMSKND